VKHLVDQPASKTTERPRDKRKEQILTQPEPSKVRQTADAIVLKEGRPFLLVTEGGDVPWHGTHGLGLFYNDCRFLDGYTLRVNGRPLTPLSADDSRGFETHHHLTNQRLPALDGQRPIPRRTLTVHRTRIMRDGAVHETIELVQHGRADVRVAVEFRFRATFEDIFVVKGFVSPRRGTLHHPRARQPDTLELAYRGRDDITRRTVVTFAPAPTHLEPAAARFELTLRHAEASTLGLTILPLEDERGRDRRAARATTTPAALRRWPRHAEDIWLSGSTDIRASNPLFERVLRRALLDLRILRSRREGRHYFVAGLPWFGTLFGRDSITVALQTLPYGAGIARETLRLLAQHQATDTDAYRDAEPGKILHELRMGELAGIGAVPQSPAYYGTVDATMLFLILVAEYVAWSGDLDLVRELRASIDAALGWTLRHADHDGDGYADYTGEYGHGLVNQGWKDSGNAIVDAEGSRARPPIALCEVQGYLYRAWRQMAGVLRVLGDPRRADDLDARAADLQERFERDFWDDTLGCYVLALQADRRPCAVVSSNSGQVLWGRIAAAERGARVAERLMQPDMFSGWGIRTLSAGATAYNPISYHLGSVWPHDNALVIAGLRHYGRDEEALRVFDGLFDIASNVRGYRLSELYCGYARDESTQRPVPYPVASSPQAWAAGAIPHALWALLGLAADAPGGCLDLIRPCLPRWLDWLDVTRLRIGPAEVDLHFERSQDGHVAVKSDIRAGHLEVRRAEGDVTHGTP
jgi:glycogen debranching enzyme